MTIAAKLDSLLALPADERLALVEALWDSLAADPAAVPVPDWHLETLKARLADDDSDASPGQSWDDARRDIERLK
jgi:putative addiction module component (TIGR02574 family)